MRTVRAWYRQIVKPTRAIAAKSGVCDVLGHKGGLVLPLHQRVRLMRIGKLRPEELFGHGWLNVATTTPNHSHRRVWLSSGC